jgi:hypothetical protein
MRRLGIWIVMAYLLALFALFAIAIYLAVFVLGGSLYPILCYTTWLLIVLSAAILLLLRSRWAMLAVGLLAVLQTVSLLVYVGTDPVPFIDSSDTDAVVTMLPLTYIWTPLALLGTTGAALLYTAWLWRSGVLR